MGAILVCRKALFSKTVSLCCNWAELNHQRPAFPKGGVLGSQSKTRLWGKKIINLKKEKKKKVNQEYISFCISRLFGVTGNCAACSKLIPAFEMVMRAKDNVYHLDCFACQLCNQR